MSALHVWRVIYMRPGSRRDSYVAYTVLAESADAAEKICQPMRDLEFWSATRFLEPQVLAAMRDPHVSGLDFDPWLVYQNARRTLHVRGEAEAIAVRDALNRVSRSTTPKEGPNEAD